jgi:hypothetical protein
LLSNPHTYNIPTLDQQYSQEPRREAWQKQDKEVLERRKKRKRKQMSFLRVNMAQSPIPSNGRTNAKQEPFRYSKNRGGLFPS